MKVLLIPKLLLIMVVLVACGQQSDEIKFRTIAMEGFEKHPKGIAENDGFSYKINFQYPSKYGDKAVLEKLQTQFIRYTLGEDYTRSVSETEKSLSEAEMKKAVEAYLAVWKKAYYDDMEEMQNLNSDPDFVIGWHIECSNAILFMNDALLQLQTKDGWYPYSAHVFESLSYHLFNLQTGDEYRRDDVFKAETDESIIRLIIPELLKYWNVRSEREVKLQRNKVWTQETNFALTAEGLLIAYNDNELTDFMPGIPSLTIPYEKIMPYLREGTPVWDVANNAVLATAADVRQSPVTEAPLADTQQTPVEAPLSDEGFSELLLEIFYKLPASVMPAYLETEEQRRSKEIWVDYEGGGNNLNYIEFGEDGAFSQCVMAGYMKEDNRNILLIVRYGEGLDGYEIKSDKTLNYHIETEIFTGIELPLDPFTADELIGTIINNEGEDITEKAKRYFNLTQKYNLDFTKEGLSAQVNLFEFWAGCRLTEPQEVQDLCDNDYDYDNNLQQSSSRIWDGKRFVKE